MNKTNKYLSEIFKMAVPITISYIAVGLMGIIDTLIVGNYDTNQLGYMGLANAIFGVLYTVPMGLLQGVSIKSSQKFGAKKFSSCGKIYNEGKKYLIYVSIIFTLLGLCAKQLLIALGQNQDMVANTAPVLMILATSIPFVLIYANANFFLQSIKRAHVAMYGIIFANIFNLILNPILVYGKFGVPAMGAEGAAITTVIIRVLLAIYLLYYIAKMKKTPKLNKRFGLDRSYETWYNDSKTTRKIGFGVAFVVVCTNGSFSLVNTFAAWLGAEAMATFVIMINVNVLFFMMMFAISQATSIVAARTYGNKDIKGVSQVLKSSYIVYGVVMSVILLILYFADSYVYGIFTNDEKVIATVASLLIYQMLDIFIDTLPLNLVSTLNARGDVKIPSINQAVSFLGFRVICSYIFAFVVGWGLIGLWIGLACGGMSSLILNSIRYAIVSKNDNK